MADRDSSCKSVTFRPSLFVSPSTSLESKSCTAPVNSSSMNRSATASNIKAAHTSENAVTPPVAVSSGKLRSHIRSRNNPSEPLSTSATTVSGGQHKVGARPSKKKKHKVAFSRRLWDEAEDKAVSELVAKYGTKRWSLIAEMLDVVYGIKGRTGKQCRERWHNHLDPEVKKLPLSAEEERLIFEGHKEYGNKWAEIAKLLNGRTDNVVKNYFYATLRRQLRKISKHIKGKRRKDPTEVTLQYIHQIMHENHIPYSELDNDNVRNMLEAMDFGMKNVDSEEKCKDTPSHRYSLRQANGLKRSKPEREGEDESEDNHDPHIEEQKRPTKPEVVVPKLPSSTIVQNPLTNPEAIASSFTRVMQRQASDRVLQRQGSDNPPVYAAPPERLLRRQSSDNNNPSAYHDRCLMRQPSENSVQFSLGAELAMFKQPSENGILFPMGLENFGEEERLEGEQNNENGPWNNKGSKPMPSFRAHKPPLTLNMDLIAQPQFSFPLSARALFLTSPMGFPPTPVRQESGAANEEMMGPLFTPAGMSPMSFFQHQPPKSSGAPGPFNSP